MLPIPKAVTLPEHKPSPEDKTELLEKADSFKELANLQSPPPSYAPLFQPLLIYQLENKHSSLQTQTLPQPLLPVHWDILSCACWKFGLLHVINWSQKSSFPSSRYLVCEQSKNKPGNTMGSFILCYAGCGSVCFGPTWRPGEGFP